MVISPKNNIFVSGNQYFSTMEFSKIIGRREEIKEINRSYHSKEAEFVIVYGRRRVGKTFLIREFFHDTKVTFWLLSNGSGMAGEHHKTT